MNSRFQSVRNLRGSAIPLCLWLAAIFCIPMQLLAGASPNIIAVDIAGITIGLFTFAQFGPGNAGAWLLLMFVFGNTLEPLFIKTILFQSIDSNLTAPFTSYTIELLGITALSSALIIVSRLNLGRPFLPPERDGHNLRVLAWSSLVIGTVGWHFHRADHQIGGFAVFRDMLFMAVICKTAMLTKSKTGKTIDLELAIIMAIGSFLGLIDDSKAYMALPIISYYLTLLFFKQKIPIPVLLISTISGFLFIEVIAPFIQVLRFLGIQNHGGWAALLLVREAISYMLNGHFLEIAAQAAGLWGAGYYDYFGSNASWSIIADRYACIQQIDPVVAKVAELGPVHFPLIAKAVETVVPHLIDSTKLPYPLSYYLLLALGFVSDSSGKYETLPLLGQLDAVYGEFNLFAVAFMIFLLYFMVLKKIGWNLKNNVFAVFFLLHFILAFANQGQIEQYLDETIREMPTFLLLFVAITYFAKGSSLAARERKFAPLHLPADLAKPNTGA